MDTAPRRTLRAIAAQLAAIVGVIHLGLGAYHWLLVPGPTGVPLDVRIVAWTGLGAAVIAGVVVGSRGRSRRGRCYLYTLGIATMAGLIAAYFAWPVLRAGSFYLGPVGRLPDGGLVAYAASRVVDARPAAQLALATELTLLVVLVVLLYDERR